MRSSESEQGQTTGKSLGPKELAGSFGANSHVAQSGVKALYGAICTGGCAEAQSALGQWRVFFGKACGHEPTHPMSKIDKLAACYGLAADELNPAELLFALHTYYALLVKLLTWQVTAAAYGKSGNPVLASQESGQFAFQLDDRLQSEIQRLESGSLFRELNVVDPFQGNLFAWYADAWHEGMAELVREAAVLLDHYDVHSLLRDPAAGGDLLKVLYEELFPGSVRHALGEYYTPDWLAEHLLDEVGYSGDPRARLLDPACGSGTFLVAAIRRVRNAAAGPKKGPGFICPNGPEGASHKLNLVPFSALCRTILSGVVGLDLNPLAVMAARANYLIAIADLLPHAGRVEVPVEIPVYLYDSILGEGLNPEQSAVSSKLGSFDYVVGNPPWIAWDNLPVEYRQATKPLWERFGLFSLSGSDARHGGGKKDLSMLMMYASADRYLKDAGRLGFVVTQTVFQTKGAGDGFRRFRLGDDGAPLKVLRVDDMVAIRPFPGVANWTATIVVEKGRPTTYPVPYTKWSSAEDPSPDSGRQRKSFNRQSYRAQPIDPHRDSSPWIVLPEGITADITRLIGPSDYRAHLGANSGGANGVYWVSLEAKTDDGVLVRNLSDKGKRDTVAVRQEIEPELVYPLVRWADVARYRAQPAAHILLAQDVNTRQGIDQETMVRQYPKTYAYLKQFRQMLTDRAAYKRYQNRAAFYSMYNVGTYTVAPLKVVWRRMDRRINAAVLGQVDDPHLGTRPVVPQETCALVAVDSAPEAHYLCAVLNSSIVNFLVASHSVCGGKGFGTPSMLDFLNLRRYDPTNPQHAELSECSRQAHRMAAQCFHLHREDISGIQTHINRLAAQLWGLGPSEIEVIDRQK